MEKIKAQKSTDVAFSKDAIDKVRRDNLAKFFGGGPLPPEEKSYISQLLKGKASFGERAARRLEQTYNMGAGYLDRDGAKVDDSPRQAPALAASSTATLAVSIIQSALMMAGLPKNFLGEEAELRTMIMQRKGNRSRASPKQ